MIILSSFLPAFAVLPPTAAGQAPVNRPYVGAPCSVNGVEMCFLSSDGAELLCDFELVVTEECAENIGENGVEAYIVSYDGLNVSVFGSCLNATSYTTSYFSCYVDSSNLQTVVLEGSKLKDQLGFRHEEAPGLVKWLYSPQQKPMVGKIQGKLQDDKVFGSEQISLYQEYLYGNDGHDVMFGFAGNDHMWGGEGPDLMHGGNGTDYMYGEGGDDFDMRGDAGTDHMDGGPGEDIMNGGTEADFMYGGDDGDTMRGGPGNDVMYGQGGVDTMHGDENQDILYGGTDGDFLWGDGGNDTLLGEEGDDELNGGNNNDRLHGGNGFDVLHGNAHADWLYGGLDTDELWGDAGNDVLCENQDSDVFPPGANTAANNFFSGGPGTDIVNIFSSFTPFPGQAPYFPGDNSAQTCLGDPSNVDCTNILELGAINGTGPADPSMPACEFLLNLAP